MSLPPKPFPGWPFAPNSEREVGIAFGLIGLSVFGLWLWPNALTLSLCLPLIALGGLGLFFFRDPERTPPPGEQQIVAPADGVVVALQSVNEETYLGGAAIRLSVFLSLFDVHVNRAPLTGRIAWTRYEPGRFGHAGKPQASEANERNSIAFESGSVKVLVRQIAGLVARRIVCWGQPGQQLPRGARLGLIKFGSRVDIFLPPQAELCVQVGSRVRGGETVIACLPLLESPR